MLVLSRKTDQSITLGDPASEGDAIEVKITEIKGDQVRLGIQAPQDVAVHRKEIWEQRQEEGRASAVGGEPLTLPLMQHHDQPHP